MTRHTQRAGSGLMLPRAQTGRPPRTAARQLKQESGLVGLSVVALAVFFATSTTPATAKGLPVAPSSASDVARNIGTSDATGPTAKRGDGGDVTSETASAKKGSTGSAFDAEFKKVRGRKLDRLFARLKTASDKRAGNTIEREIWRTWMTTGNVELDFLLRQSQIALQEGGVEEAVGALDRVVELAPDFAEGWNRRATLYYMMGRFPESVADIQQTLSLEPRHFGALSGLGMILMAEKKWGSALEAFEKAYEVNPWLRNGPALLKSLRQKVKGQPL
ncbi:MAG: tetratricopeptide repeat protein [Pseudomonadota bacterium]